MWFILEILWHQTECRAKQQTVTSEFGWATHTAALGEQLVSECPTEGFKQLQSDILGQWAGLEQNQSGFFSDCGWAC